jgi:hypothetical protein
MRGGRGGRGHRAPVSRRLSAHRHSLLGPSCARRGVGPPSRSACRAPAPGPRRGCHVPHGRDPAGVGAPCTPGRRCSRGWLLVTSRRLPLPSGQPCPRPRIPSPGVSISGHQREFAHAHPSGLPLACGPRMERAPLGVSPDAPHPAVTGSARQGGDGSANTNPELRCCHHAQPSFQRAHSNRATSCRTEEVEPVAQVHHLGLGW